MEVFGFGWKSEKVNHLTRNSANGWHAQTNGRMLDQTD
jgi:hypothetical protein